MRETGRVSGWGLLVPCGVLAVLLWESWPVTVDDAYIALRHARHWVEHGNPSFDPSERVEAYSSFAAVALATGVLRAGGDPLLVAKALGGACAFALVWITWRLALRLGAAPGFALLGAGLLSVSTGVGFWAVSGMETAPFALLLNAGVWLLLAETSRARWGAAGLLGLAALSRLEGPVLVAAAVAGHALAGLAGGRSVRQLAREHAFALAIAAAWLLWFAWRWHYYGHLFPTPIYFKRIDAAAGLWRSSSAAFARASAPLLLLAAAALRCDRRSWTPLAVVAAALVVFAGSRQSVDDVSTMNWFHRYFVPVLPCAIAAAMLALDRLRRRLGASLPRRVGVGVVAAFLLLWQLTSPSANPLPLLARTRAYPTAVAARNVPAARYLDERLGPRGRVVAGDVGALGYFYRGHVWDLFGLTSYGRALRHDGALEPWVDELLARAPDAIQLCFDAVSHDPPQPCLRAERAVAVHPSFRAHYVSAAEFGREGFPQAYYAIYLRREPQ